MYRFVFRIFSRGLASRRKDNLYYLGFAFVMALKVRYLAELSENFHLQLSKNRGLNSLLWPFVILVLLSLKILACGSSIEFVS
jgi:hypothetical protein